MTRPYWKEKTWVLRVTGEEPVVVRAGNYQVFQDKITFSSWYETGRWSGMWEEVATYYFPFGSSVNLLGTVVGEK